MSTIIELETPRLRLRQWRESDREPYAAMSADRVVMEFFRSLQSRGISDASIDGWQSQLAARGWSNWAVELLESGQFIGFVGLSVPRRALPFSPCVEVGWRLARRYWGQGFATEGARAALGVGFERLALPEIVSFTSVGNLRSRAVMERLGMINANRISSIRGCRRAIHCGCTVCIGSRVPSGAGMRPDPSSERPWAFWIS